MRWNQISVATNIIQMVGNLNPICGMVIALNHKHGDRIRVKMHSEIFFSVAGNHSENILLIRNIDNLLVFLE